ncbi:hypothetical protein RI367_007598 [Sorochytrium milnesiophthora]
MSDVQSPSRGVRRTRQDFDGDSASHDGEGEHMTKWHRTPGADDNDAAGTVEVVLTCPYCQTTFTTQPNLDAHVQSNHMHTCAQTSCAGVTLPTARLLSIHLQEAHSPLFRLQRQKEGARMFECFVAECAGKYVDNSARRRHLKHAHGWTAQRVEETVQLVWRGRETFKRSQPVKATEDDDKDVAMQDLTQQIHKLNVDSVSFGRSARKTFRGAADKR